MRLRLYYCDHYEIPLPAGHKFPMLKYRLLREELERSGLFDLVPARLAEREEIELVHHPEYVALFLKGMLDPGEMRRIGFPWSEKLVRRTLASVGGTVDAARDALARGCGGNLAGGTHHAFPGAGAGFCIFNDIAVAIRSLQRDGAVRRAAILDLDVHQGDGTAAIFRDDPDVLTTSVHAANNFPFRKQESKVDIPLPDKAGDAEYLDAVDTVVSKALEFGPGIVFYQSGVDGLAGDALGRLALTREGLRERDRRVLERCRKAGVPIAVTLGGGYAKDLLRIAAAHRNTFLEASRIFDPWAGHPPTAPGC